MSGKGDRNATYLEVGGTKNKEHLKEGVCK